MKKIFLTCFIALTAYVFAQASITCVYVSVHIDSNETTPIDVDGDGTNDFILHAEYSPFVNNYITGISGNEIEVRGGGGVELYRARRIESGDPVGSFAWNDTAYMIQNGQGAFSGGQEEYGHIGLRLNKNGNFHYAFLELRAPYWQALVEVFTKGYNDVALAETRTDACPLSINGPDLEEANAYVTGNQLHVSLLGNAASRGSEVQLISVTGQVVLTENLLQAENDIPLKGISGGAYLVAILQEGRMVQRKKVFIP